MGSVKLGEKKIDVPDNSSIIPACEELGIPFSCKEGVCGSCLIRVLKGDKNLSEKNDAEKAFGLPEENDRLACQCTLKSGDVEIESGY